MDDILMVDRADGIVTLTLNRPAVLNALNRLLLERLERILSDVREDRALRAVIITGAGGRAFAAGADIAELAALGGALEAASLARLGQHITRLLEALPVPVIAAVEGYALGGGCELALACDLRVAGAGARFGQPEVGLGIVPGYGGT